MLKPINTTQYSKKTVRDYIVMYYGTRPGSFKSLCFEDDDPGDGNLHTIYLDLDQKQNLIFRNKIEDLIETTLRINKYDKLILLLKTKNPKFDIHIIGNDNSSISSPSAKTVSGTSQSNQNNKAWAKHGNLPGAQMPSVTQPDLYEDKNMQIDLPQIGNLHQEIVHLEKNIEALGEIDGALEILREKISELLLDIKVKRQMVENEQLQAANKSNVFHSEQKGNFQVSKPTSLHRQPFSSSPSSSWRGTSFSKPN
jgi:hypothetical protein